MNWSWSLESEHYVLSPHPLPPGVSRLGFIGRPLRPGAGDPLGDVPRVRLDQVHGRRVAICSRPGPVPEADGARTREPGLVLTIRTADCLPVLLAAPEDGIALLHAGWRGLVGGILEAGAAGFPDPGAVTAIVGPGIGICCFEVGEEVAEQFDPAHTIRFARPHVDLAGAAVARLVAAGIPAGRVHRAPGCTRCHQHLMPSHRGSGGKPGRLLAFAAATPRHSQDS